MKTFLLLLVLSFSCTHTPMKPVAEKNYFSGMKGCFLLFNLKTGQYEKTIGDTCNEQYPACSTFKVPLAVMAFDSGVLKDEKQTLNWDGQKKTMPSWEMNHNAQTWMRDSVVWFSQRLTPKLGEKKLKKYLKDFNYGNQDISSGLTTAWLNAPSIPGLKITAYEQVDFMTKLWSNNLPVSKRAMELTQKITHLETSPKGFFLNGKTGSNYWDRERKVRFGWFVAHISSNDKQYIIVTNMSDLSERAESSIPYGGPQAKEITKTILADLGLW